MIREVLTDGEIARCYPVMRQLRPHLVEERFVETVRRQISGGYRLACLESEGKVRSVAGFRILENLASGRVLYVDDLVSDEGARSRGHGARLLRWLIGLAREEGCQTLELDSGVHRADAHRFYFTNRLTINSFHFRMDL
ncbi:MAG TPA: GNAT family N-acetyltransferase [Longimicrobiaceae bacterium]